MHKFCTPGLLYPIRARKETGKPTKESSAIVQFTDGGHICWGGSSGGHEKWKGTEDFLKVELVQFLELIGCGV